MRAHGTRACYVFGPESGSDRSKGCRCEPCREANRSYARERDRATRRPDVAVEPAYIDATEVREHLLWLHRQGVGRRAINAQSGVALSSIVKLRTGQLTRCRPTTARKILDVLPSDVSDGALVDARKTWRLINALVRAGYTRSYIAGRLGSTAETPALQIGRRRCTAANARAVRALHHELLGDTLPALSPANTPRATPKADVLTDEQRAMVEANTGLIGWVLNRRRTPDLEWEDSFQDGLFGLIRAVQLFDPARGFKFSTYAEAWIRQAVQRGRATYLGIGYRQNRDDWVTPISIDAPVGDGDSLDLGGLIPDERQAPAEQAEAAALVEQIAGFVAELDLDRVDKVIVEDLFTPTDESWLQRDTRVAADLGISREVIRQRRIRLQGRLRAWAEVAA